LFNADFKTAKPQTPAITALQRNGIIAIIPKIPLSSRGLNPVESHRPTRSPIELGLNKGGNLTVAIWSSHHNFIAC
jgi:hypothetical protein